MKIIKRYVIPIALILFSLYLILSQYKREQVGLFTIIRYFDESNISGVKNRELLAGEKVTGIFTATENNLGTVSVRFNTFWRINDDWLIFRIKSVNDERWFYENKYKVDQFQNGKMFPFGFPELKDSSKKTYVFEIESTQGITDNAIAVSGISPAFHVRYRFPKETIIKSNNFEGISSVGKILKYNLGSVLDYLFTRLSADFTDRGKGITTAIYMAPVFLYVLYYQKRKSQLFIVLLLLLVLDVLFLKESSDTVTEILLTGIIGYLFLTKKESIFLARAGLVLLVLTAITYYLSTQIVSIKLGAWSFLFIFISLIQLTFENRKSKT